MDVKTPQTNHLSIALYEEKKRETYLPDMHIIRCQRLVINYEMMTQKEKFTSFRRSSIFISFFYHMQTTIDIIIFGNEAKWGGDGQPIRFLITLTFFLCKFNRS